MVNQQKKKEPLEDSLKLKKIVLPTDSNTLDFIAPSTTLNFSDSTADIQQQTKMGAKATPTESEVKQFEYQQRLRESQHILQDPVATQAFITQANERRRAMEASAAESRILFEQRRAFEVAEKRTKERQAARELMLRTENPTKRQIRLEEERNLKDQRQGILDRLLRQKQKALEACEIYFEQNGASFLKKYKDNAIDLLSDSPVVKIITSRSFGTNKYGNQKYAYRCNVCGYNSEESLLLYTVHKHIFESPLKHKQALLAIIEKEYTQQTNEARFAFNREDNPDFKQSKLDAEIEALKKIKTRLGGH